jgi:tRNA dimethylallyltransferase
VSTVVSKPALIAVMGATGAGKTALAERLADEFEAELINADAFQAYRGMDIGTAKPDDKKRYHLLDIKDPKETYGLGEFCQRAQTLLEDFWEEGRNVVVVGGTGLYIRGLFEEYEGLQPTPPEELRASLQQDLQQLGLLPLVERLKALKPNVAQEVDLNNPVRVTRALERLLDDRPPLRVRLPGFRKLKLGISVPLPDLLARIEKRTHLMVQNGWVKEVEGLLELNFGPGDPGFRAIGYTEIAHHILGQTGLDEALATTIAETRRYAKRQRTWLRSEPSLVDILTASSSLHDEALARVRSLLQ